MADTTALQTVAPQQIFISNVVLTAGFNYTLDLSRLAWILEAEYNPAVFAAAQLRLQQPAATALMFASGRIVVTGARSESAALTSVYCFTRMIQKAIQADLRITDIKIQNIVASANVGKYISLEDISKKLLLSTIYDASLFPGLRLKITNPPMKALLFLGGKIVLTGARNRDDIRAAWSIIYTMIKPYLSDTKIVHADVTSAKNARKKLIDISKELDVVDEFDDPLHETLDPEGFEGFF